MAISIAHKVLGADQGYLLLEDIYNAMVALPGRFTIVDSASIGFESGWFVFSLVGGTGWQCWLGGRGGGGTTWSSANTFDGAGSQSDSISCAFSPRGGWNAATDAPSGAMFSNAPAENGGAAGQYWLRIRPISPGNYYSAGVLHWLTIWDDPATGMFVLLIDMDRNNAWDDGMAIMPIDSRFPPEDDDAPYALLCGPPRYGSSSACWLAPAGGPATWSSMLVPGDSASPPINAFIYVEPFRVLDAQTQPDPVNGNYDLDAIGVYSKTPGAGHSRGYIKPACLRQSKAVDAARATYHVGTWAVPFLNAQIVLPWNNSAF